jgi:hypothetical protein
MDDIEIAVQIAELKKEIDSARRRIQELEDQEKVIHGFAISIQELALNMKSMMKELQLQSNRILLLEQEPGERLKQMKTAIITALTTALIGGFVSAFLLK